VLDAGETCDDGNLASGDGCNAQCQIENEGPGGTSGGGGGPGSDGSDDGDDDGGLIDDGRLRDRGCTCQADPEGQLPGALGLLGLWVLGWRRRRPRSGR